MRKFLSFIDNSKHLYITIFIVVIVTNILPLPQQIIPTIYTFFFTLMYLNILRNSIMRSTTILRMIRWLLIAPILISIIVASYISMIWKPILEDMYFLPMLLLLFILSWLFAAYKFEYKKIKAAVTILNGLFMLIIALVFLTTLNADLSKMVFDKDTIQSAYNNGISANSIIEIVVKFITLPFVISALLAQVLLELRCLEIIKK